MASFVTMYGYDVSAPATVPTLSQGPSGSMGVGLYSYKVTFVTAFGETTASAASASFATLSGGINLTNIPTFAGSDVTSRKLYRTTSGGGTWLFAGSVAGNLTSVYTDTLADGGLGSAPPAFNTASSREIARGYCAMNNPSIVSVQTGITAGAGGTSAAAYQLTAEDSYVTTAASSGDSVRLPGLNINLVGMQMLVKNNTLVPINIFPFTGQFISPLGADTAVSLGAGSLLAFTATSATTWTPNSTGTGGGAGALGYSMFYGTAPGDYAATIAVGAPLDFPHASVTGGASPVVRSGVGLFTIPVIGVYQVNWEAGITEAGQLMLSSSATGLNVQTVMSRATGTSQIVGSVMIATTVINEVISCINPPGNATALTVTPSSGSLTHAPAATITFLRLA